MRPFSIYAFVTQDSPYQEVAEQYIIPSAKKLNLEVKILKAPNYHAWGKNVAQKPLMISKLLEEGIDNIVFLDCDATIDSYPQLFHDIPDEYDIAFHTLHWNTWYNRPKDTTTELLSGTLFLRNRPIVKKLVNEWYEKASDGSIWEQRILEKIISNYDLKTYDLPLSYCFINVMPNGKEPYVKCDNVIFRHHQVSRIYKHRGEL